MTGVLLIAVLLAAQDAPPDRSHPAWPIAQQSWVPTGSQPPEAVRAGQGGASFFRLDVDATGKVVDCTVVGPSGWPVLDTATCRILMERARFRPALDAAGAPVAASYSNRINWYIDEGRFTRSFSARTGTFETDPKGVLAHCVVEDDGVVSTGFFHPCAPPLPFESNWNSPGPDPRFNAHRFLRRTEQRIEGASPARFVPPAGARVVTSEVTKLIVEPDGSVTGCEVERAHEGWNWKGPCSPEPYVPQPGGSRAHVERSETLWDLGPVTP